MKMLKPAMLVAAFGFTLSSSALCAGEYRYMDRDMRVTMDDTSIALTVCPTTKEASEIDPEKDCRNETLNLDDLKNKLEVRIGEYKAMLENRAATETMLKSMVDDGKATEVDDQRSGVTYLLIPIAPGMTIPLLKENVEGGDLTRAFIAIEANIARYQTVFGILDSGELPPSGSFESTVEARTVNDLHNIIMYSNAL